MDYLVDGGNRVGISASAFSVAANGDVTSQNLTAAVGTRNRLEIATTPVRIDPTTFSGLYRVGGADFAVGIQNHHLIPSLRY